MVCTYITISNNNNDNDYIDANDTQIFPSDHINECKTHWIYFYGKNNKNGWKKCGDKIGYTGTRNGIRVANESYGIG